MRDYEAIQATPGRLHIGLTLWPGVDFRAVAEACLLYTSDAADERSSVDLGGRRIIKKKKNAELRETHLVHHNVDKTADSHNHTS